MTNRETYTDTELKDLALNLSDDPKWKELINRLSIEEIADLLRQNGFEIIRVGDN